MRNYGLSKAYVLFLLTYACAKTMRVKYIGKCFILNFINDDDHQSPCMKNFLTHSLPILFILVASAFTLFAQPCDSPPQLCPGQSSGGADTQTGLPVALPASFCFQSENAVFFSFQTKSTAYPSVNYQDSSATLSLSGISCLQDTLYGNGLNIAVYSASDPCDESTFSPAVICETNITGSEDFELNSLEPSTTYYVVISGLIGDPPAINPSECEFNIAAGGPAITYQLEVNADPDLLYQGQEVSLSANSDFSPYSWQGEILNSPEGNPVTAEPDEIGQSYTYTATTTIDGCEYSASTQVLVVPAIIPYNTFTPNGDGVNDFWEIEGIMKPENRNAQISVYSRWGQKVFQTTGYNEDWDGDGLPAATYYYVIELNPLEYDTDPYTGSVTIIY